MAFTFGGFDTRNLDRLIAPLKTWPSLAGRSPATTDIPGMDGVFYGGANLGALTLTFDAIAQAASQAAVQTVVDQLMQALAPAPLQPLTPQGYEGFAWQASLAGPVAWQYGQWLPGLPWQMRADIAFLAPDPYGYASPDETFTGTSTINIVRAKGNMASWPRIEITGSFTAVTLTAGTWTLTVTAKVTSGQVLVLDFATQDYAIWDQAMATKMAHIAQGMSGFDRLTLPMGSTILGVAASGGSVTSVTVCANSRRA